MNEVTLRSLGGQRCVQESTPPAGRSTHCFAGGLRQRALTTPSTKPLRAVQFGPSRQRPVFGTRADGDNMEVAAD